MKAAKEVYLTFWDSFVKGDVEALASTLDDNFEYIGSTDTEVYHNKAEMMDFYKSYKDDVAGNAEIRNRQIDVIPLENLILVNEHSDLYALVDSDWAMYAKIRFSALLWHTKTGWKLIQTHNSFPDMRAQEGEILAFEKLKEENVLLQEAVKQRTIELEQKNKELEKAIENLKSTQAQLIQSEKLASLGELTAGIAHEIQNPLNFVNNFSEVSAELVQEIKEERQKPKENQDELLVDEIFNDISQNLEKITLHGKRASSIVKGMLEHSRTSKGVKELTDINKLADEYLRLSYHGIRAKDNTFNADYELIAIENLPKIAVIPQDIGRVLLNLINNAFWAVAFASQSHSNEYSPKVIVKTSSFSSGEGRGEVCVEIIDNGTGISEDVKAKIFQPFFTTKPTGQGTGLGLSLAYDIITKGHGGTVEVESVEGEGTTFIVKLPIV